MDFIVEYLLPNGTVRKIIVRECKTVAEALAEVRKRHGDDAADHITSITPAVGL